MSGDLQVEVTSWLGGAMLATVPVVTGSWEVTDESGVTLPGTVKFSVPATTDWIPAASDHPLAAFGQRVRVRVGWRDESLATWGWYRLDQPGRSGSVITCTGKGLLREVQRARLTKAISVVSGASRATTVKSLLSGILPVVIDSGLTDETMGAATFDAQADRLDTFWTLLEAWPARAVVDEQTVQVLPDFDDDDPGDPEVSLIDGDGGTLLEPLQPSGDSSDPYNGYLVSTVPENDDVAVTGWWGVESGAMAWGGAYGCNPAFYSSSFLNGKTEAELVAIAKRMTLREQASAVSLQFTAQPDPAVRVGQVASVVSSRQSISGVGRIMSLSLTRSAMSGTVTLL